MRFQLGRVKQVISDAIMSAEAARTMINRCQPHQDEESAARIKHHSTRQSFKMGWVWDDECRARVKQCHYTKASQGRKQRCMDQDLTGIMGKYIARVPCYTGTGPLSRTPDSM